MKRMSRRINKGDLVKKYISSTGKYYSIIHEIDLDYTDFTIFRLKNIPHKVKYESDK